MYTAIAIPGRNKALGDLEMNQERWVFIDKAGRLVLHIENDGAAFLRRGAEVSEEVVTLEFLRQRYPKQYWEAVRLREERSKHGKTRTAIHR